VHPVFESVDTYDAQGFLAWLQEPGRAREGFRYQLLNGRIVRTPPAGWPHGSIEGNRVRELGAFVRQCGAGRGFGSSQGYLLPSGDASVEAVAGGERE
jgi:Uma2 family endonuclease